MAFGKDRSKRKSKGQFDGSEKGPTKIPVAPIAFQTVGMKLNDNVTRQDTVSPDASNILVAYNKHTKAIEANNENLGKRLSLKEAWRVAKSTENIDDLKIRPMKGGKTISVVAALGLEYGGLQLLNLASNTNGVGQVPLTAVGLVACIPTTLLVNQIIRKYWQKFKVSREQNSIHSKSFKDRFPHTGKLLMDYQTIRYYRTTEERRVGVIIKTLAAEFALAGGAIAYASTQSEDLKMKTALAAGTIISLSFFAIPKLLHEARGLEPKHFIGSADGSGGGTWI